MIFSIDIPFKGSRSLSYAESLSVQCHWHSPPLISGVTGSAHHWSAVSLRPPTTGQRCQLHCPPLVIFHKICLKNLHWHHPQVVNGFIYNAQHCQRCHWQRWPQNQRFHSRIARQIRIHMQKGFNPCIRGSCLMKSCDTVPVKSMTLPIEDVLSYLKKFFRRFHVFTFTIVWQSRSHREP
jgi:hypothetical protein